MLRIVYFVRAGDDNEELRYSLRSLSNLHADHDVTIAGYKPTWIADTVTHLDVPQTGNKHSNFNASMAAACDTYPDGFVMWYDDIFLMRPITEIPSMMAGPLDQHTRYLIDKDGPNAYNKGIAKAGDILTNKLHHPGPLFCYDAIHVPQHINPPAMRWALNICKEWGCNHRLTIHGNLAGYTDATPVVNAKRNDGWETRAWVSTSDKRFALEGGVGSYIRGAFPVASRWERVG